MRHVAAIPYPGRGHVNSMVNLCRSLLLLSSNEEEEDLLISFVITEEWLSLISGDPPPPDNLRLVTIPNVIPSELGRAKDLGGFVDAVCTKMEAPVEILMEAMELPVMGILADTMLPWAVKLGRRRDVPVFSLFPMSAALFWENVPGGEAEPIMKYISSHNSMQLSDARYNLTSEIEKRLMETFSMLREVQAILFASFYELEPEVIDALRENLHCPIYPIGPSIPYMMLDENPNNNDVDCMGWLNLQPKQSVLYVSLGSFLSVSDTQMDEIAMGLRLSGTRLLWAARGESSRLQEMVGSMGIVVPWCDQLNVLNHSSVGGFLTHCGWNSTMEAVFCGVPMITFPILADQPVNSRLILDKWKVGLSLGGENGREIVVGHEEVSLVVKRMMDLDGAESKDMRKRAAKLQDFARGAIVPGGSSMKNLASFVKDLIMKGDNRKPALLNVILSGKTCGIDQNRFVQAAYTNVCGLILSKSSKVPDRLLNTS